jgi:excisionase family DNA binding protein
MHMQMHDEGPGGCSPPAPVRVRSVKDIAKPILGVSVNTVYALIYEKKLKATKVGSQWRIADRDLLAFLGQSEEVR